MMFCQFVLFICISCVSSYVLPKHCNITLTKKLVRCNCSSRNLTFIPTDCPPNTTDLYLSNNNLNIIARKTFTKYTQLRYLDISDCNVTSIDKSAFDNLPHLKELSLVDNPMKSFQRNVFEALDELQVLHISHDLLSTYLRESWLDFLNITKVFCYGGPSNGSFAEIFSVMKNLKYLHSEIQIHVLRNCTFHAFEKTPLRYLKIKGKLMRIETDSFLPVRFLSSLVIPDARFLKLSNTLPALHVFENRQMNELDLNNNFRVHGEFIITTELFAYIGNICVKKLSLTFNGIRMIDAVAFQNMKYKHCLENVNLSNNDFDSHQLYTIWYFNLFTHLKRLDMSNINNQFNKNKVKIDGTGRTLDKTDLTDNKSLYIIPSSSPQDIVLWFPLPFEFLNISCIDVIGNSINSLTLKGLKHLQLLDLAYTSLYDCNYTINGLQYVKVLNISHFKCSLLNHKLLQSGVNLEQLIMQSSSLSIGLKGDHQSMFLHGLKRLKHIDFARNAFKDRFRISTFKNQLDILQSLILEGNLFTSIPLRVDDFNRLSVLNVRNNKIAYLTTKEIDAIEVLFEKSNRTMTVLLEGNPLVCSCISLDFVEWLFTTKVKLDSNGSYSCVKKDGYITTTNAVYNHLRIIRISCITTSWVIFSVTLFAVLLFFILVGYRYKLHLQYFCLFIGMANPLFRKSKEEALEYDAYVAYCDSDYKWVYGPLRLFLEERRNYKLLLSDRGDGDVHPGQNRLAISNSISKCKKIILVISNEFVNNEWANYEANVGIEHFLGLQARIIVINLESVTKTEIPHCVLHMMSLDANDHIRKTDTLNENNIFWKCLDKAMKR
ncbi:toll-like receptor 4 [Mytilus californianus]|uniref:toll-like receptor 4 n=1 Tax=Mytilus californianus TaxID=6549 RepID=UPI0022461FFB|nr:toll-like receptor 4 [Mytilus californianus]